MPIAHPTHDVPWTRRDPAAGPWRLALVYGLGLSGRAAADFLLGRGAGVVAFDRRAADELDEDVVRLADEAGLRLELGQEPESLPTDLDWDNVDGVVVSPGVPSDRPLLAEARLRGVPVIGEVELALPFLNGRLVGITGSNGKSTTTSLAGVILEAAGLDAVVCGNIGEPLIRQVPDRSGDESADRIYVVELSSFQLESVETLRPDVGALLNLSADHLDRHADLQGYREAKLRLFRLQGREQVAVLNADDPLVVSAVPRLGARCRFFSRRGPVADGCWAEDGRVWEIEPGGERERLFDLADLPLPGPHNLENAMAAALVARSLGGVPVDAVVRGLRSFRGLPHRVEKVRELAGVVFYDDSKGTNPGATVQSVRGFGDERPNVRLILGGRFKGGDLAPLVEAARRRVAKAYLIGESAERFARALESSVPHEIVHTVDRAVERAAAEAREGDVVLLSPACSSFDQFTHFVERGRAFQRRVEALDAADLGRDAGDEDREEAADGS